MESRSSQPTNVIRFPGTRSSVNPRRDQKSLMDAVYAAGSLPVPADDRATKDVAIRLHIFGFVVIDEVLSDGTARRMRPSESFKSSTLHPWRVSKPSGPHRIDDAWPETDEELFAALLA